MKDQKTKEAGRPRVVIIGAGFGGLNAVQALRSVPVDVTVVDCRNHHVFQPLLYQVATAGLSANDIAYPIRSILKKQENATVLFAEAKSVDLKSRLVTLTDGELPYDYLILAAGARHSYFGKDEWEQLAPGLKTLDDALEIRKRLLCAYEEAERETDPVVRGELLTFVIVGGGPTGVELAGAIAEIAHKVLLQDYRSIDPDGTKIVLIEGSPRLLGGFPEELSHQAERALRRRGVEVVTGVHVTAMGPDSVTAGEREIRAATKFWAAGNAAAPLARTLGVPLDRAGRVKALPDLSVPGFPEAFVIGDIAAVPDESGKPLPGVASVAIQQGRHAARNIVARLAGEENATFRYHDRGSLATVGRSFAVASVGRYQFSGMIAWLLWALVHVAELIGFRNRIAVLYDWAWAYLRFSPPARIVYGSSESALAAWHQMRRAAPARPEPPNADTETTSKSSE